MVAPHYGVVYDAVTLAPRRVIVPSDRGAKSLFDGTHKPHDGEVLCTVSHDEVKHLIGLHGRMPDLESLARHAIKKHANREPPSLSEVHERKL